MIEVRPYDDFSAMSVLSRLDPNDQLEAEAIRGAPSSHLELFADWRAVQAHGIISHVLALDAEHGGAAFAVLTLGHTGQSGVAQAALLARDHRKYRRGLASAALRIRHHMPEFCAAAGIHRVEARCWADHPTAAAFLAAVGFEFETNMHGFGAYGSACFKQYAWVNQTTKGERPCA